MLRIICRRACVFCLLIMCALTSPVAATTQMRCEGAACGKQTAGVGKTIRVGYTQFSPYAGTSNTGVAGGT